MNMRDYQTLHLDTH